MFTSTDLKATITEVRPIIERQLDDAALISAHRERVTAAGGDWSQVKAIVKAMIQDERDEAGDHKKVGNVIGKAEHALAYADMLGLGNLNEKNSSDDGPLPTIYDVRGILKDHEIVDDQSTAVDLDGGSEDAPVPVDTNLTPNQIPVVASVVKVEHRGTVGTR